jgi:hypothetical protein
MNNFDRRLNSGPASPYLVIKYLPLECDRAVVDPRIPLSVHVAQLICIASKFSNTFYTAAAGKNDSFYFFLVQARQA